MSDKPLSKAKFKNFRKKVFDITTQELDLRAQVKRLYDQLILDAGDNEIALRHARQAFYQIQKYRHAKRMEEIMEFHPFFGANALSSSWFQNEEEEEEEDDDGII